MRATPFSIAGLLSLLVLLVAPIVATPPAILNGGAEYAFTVSAGTYLTCYATPRTVIVPCPEMPVFFYDVNGTIGWKPVELSGTAALLNDTVTVAPGLDQSFPTTAHSFLESVDLTTRQVSFIPRVDGSALISSYLANYGSMLSTSGMNITSMERAMSFAGPFYTIWWVDVPLSLGDSVNVLRIRPAVNGTRTVDLGSLGSREAWTLSYSRGKILNEMPCAIDSCSYGGTDYTLDAAFSYEQSTGTLLTASLDIQLQQVINTYRYSPQYGAVVTTMGRSFSLHVSMRLTAENPPISFCCVIPIDNPPTTSPQTTNSNSIQTAPSPGLLDSLTAPRSLASIAVAVALVGLVGIALVRRAKTGPKADPPT